MQLILFCLLAYSKTFARHEKSMSLIVKSYSGQYYTFFGLKLTQIDVIYLTVLNYVFKSTFQEISKLRFFY